MEKESIFDLIFGSLIIGIVLAFFAFAKLGVLDFLIGKKDLPRIVTQQMQMEVPEVDSAQLDEPHPDRSESRARANRSDKPE